MECGAGCKPLSPAGGPALPQALLPTPNLPCPRGAKPYHARGADEGGQHVRKIDAPQGRVGVPA